jgi:hypothetical protein
MAARHVLAVAALAALLVLATCDSGNLRTFWPRPGGPTNPVYTFGWANIRAVPAWPKNVHFDMSMGQGATAPALRRARREFSNTVYQFAWRGHLMLSG